MRRSLHRDSTARQDLLEDRLEFHVAVFRQREALLEECHRLGQDVELANHLHAPTVRVAGVQLHTAVWLRPRRAVEAAARQIWTRMLSHG